MFCAGGVTSIGLIFGFLGGCLWGRGRLLAPPTASLEPHRHTHINRTTANMRRHTAAILALTLLHSRIRIIAQLFVFLLPFVSQFSSFFYWIFCHLGLYLLFLICFTQPEEMHKESEGKRQTMWNRGWSIRLNINLVYWRTLGHTAVQGPAINNHYILSFKS